jgi:hypothetical protein
MANKNGQLLTDMETIFGSGSGKNSDPVRRMAVAADDGLGFDELRSLFNKIDRMNAAIAARVQHNVVRPAKTSCQIIAPDPAGEITHQPLGHGPIDGGALASGCPSLAGPASGAGKAVTGDRNIRASAARKYQCRKQADKDYF